MGKIEQGKNVGVDEGKGVGKGVDPQLTELVFLLDRSGSMHGLEADTIGGFNGVLEKHKAASGRAVVSTVLFDHESLVLHDRIDINDVAPLTKADYETRGSTALLDAIGGAIHHIARVQRYMPDGHKAGNVVFVITTDGMENASHTYSATRVREMIEHETEKYGWEFVFLGANIDAVAEAGRLGIPEDRAVTCMPDTNGHMASFEAIADFTCAARSAGASRQDASWKRAVEKDRASRR